MDRLLKKKLEELRDDFSIVSGSPFEHFFCPILYRDEEVELCRGHIVNSAFPGSSKAWTVQRKDVDSFFGAYFEEDFLGILYKEGVPAEMLLTDKVLSRRFRPKMFLNSKPVEHFIARGKIPAEFTEVAIDSHRGPSRLALKIASSQLFKEGDPSVELEVAKDVRLSAVVSLLKAAHLTLFKLVGYRYVFSASGYYVGRSALGDFYLKNRSRTRSAVVASAGDHFRPYVSMIRPVVGAPNGLRGTIEDGVFYLCWSNAARPWAFLTFIRTSSSLHSVLMPIFESPESIAIFLRFLTSVEEEIKASLTQYDGTAWRVSPRRVSIKWPKTGVFYP